MSAWPWFAIRTRSRSEHLVARGLAARELLPFAPTYRVRRKWTDRVKDADLPLFPGYVFCCFDPLQTRPVITTPGVAGLVIFDGRPAPVDASEMSALLTTWNAGLAAVPYPFVHVGHRVRIGEGPLTGAEGSVVEVPDGLRFIVAISLLQRAIAVAVDRHCVRPLG